MPKDGYVGAPTLDERGRCCGRKPLHYKGGSWRSPAHPMKFCDRCDREFDPATGAQRENWAWLHDGAAFVRRTKANDTAHMTPNDQVQPRREAASAATRC